MKRKLMIVDDSLFVFEEMKMMLADTEFEIVSYEKSGESALENFDSVLPEIVTMDIILPGMDGMDTAEVMLKRQPQTKVVVVSSLAYDETIERAKTIGAQEFLFKPFDKEQLLQALRKALE